MSENKKNPQSKLSSNFLDARPHGHESECSEWNFASRIVASSIAETLRQSEIEKSYFRETSSSTGIAESVASGRESQFGNPIAYSLQEA